MSTGIRSEEVPGPWRITFVTSPDDCNLRCLFCREHSPLARAAGRGPARPPRRMAIELIRQVLEERRGSPLREVIPSTMGEPLLYPGLDALVDLCAGRGLSLNLTTNGTFPGRGAAAWGARLYPVASDVKISWLGATAATAEALMPGLRFEEALEALRTFVAGRDAFLARTGRRCRVSLQVTALEPNLGELPRIVELAARLGLDRVKVNQLQVHFESQQALSLRRSPEAIARWNQAVRASRAAAARFPDRPLRLENLVELSPDPGQPAPRGPCPFVGREAWIGPDGRFAPCCAPRAAELGDFGSVQDQPLGEIWRSARFRELVAGYAERPLCQACSFRRPGGA